MQLLSNHLVCIALLALYCEFVESEFNVTEVLSIFTSNEATLQRTILGYYGYTYRSDGLINSFLEATEAGLIRVSNQKDNLTKLEYGTRLSYDNFVVSSRKSNPFILSASIKKGTFYIETRSGYVRLCGRRKIVGRSYNSKKFEATFVAIVPIMTGGYSRIAEVFVHVYPISLRIGAEPAMKFLKSSFNETSMKNIAQISGNSLFLYSIISSAGNPIFLQDIQNFVKSLLKLVVHEDFDFALSQSDPDVDGTQESRTAVEAMKRIDNNKGEILKSMNRFYLYAYDVCTNDYIEDGGDDMFDGANKIEIWADDETPKKIKYNTFYQSSGEYEFLSSMSWPFAALMYIDNSGGNTESFSIRVSGNAGADGYGQFISYDGNFSSFNAYWTIKYTVNQIYDAGDPTICKVYFAIYRSADGSTIFKRTYSGGTGNPRSTVSLSNYPKQAWMGYTLLSRVGGQIILKNETEEVVRTFAREIISTDISLIPWIMKKIDCSTAPLIIQWLRTKHFLDPMYTMQIQDIASGQITNTSIQILMFEPPAITMAELPSASSHICVTVTTMSTSDKTAVVEQKAGRIKGKLTAYTTVTHSNKKTGKSFRLNFLDIP